VVAGTPNKKERGGRREERRGEERRGENTMGRRERARKWISLFK
jgi:hypothetical protein